MSSPATPAVDQCGLPVGGQTPFSSRKRASSAQEAPRRPPAEDLGDREAAGSSRSSRLSLVAQVAGRRARRDVHAAADRLADRGRPVLLDPLQLELGDQGQDPDREASHRRRAVEVVLDRHQPRAGLVQPPDRLKRINRRASEAIQPGDHDPARLAGLAARERLLEHRPLELGTRLVDLLPPPHDLDLVQLGPVLDLLPLHLGRDERLALATSPAADSDVAVHLLGLAHFAAATMEAPSLLLARA